MFTQGSGLLQAIEANFEADSDEFVVEQGPSHYEMVDVLLNIDLLRPTDDFLVLFSFLVVQNVF